MSDEQHDPGRRVFFGRVLEGEDLPRPFNVPLPPPPPGHAVEDVLFVVGDAPDAEGGREHEDIMVRRVPTDVARRFRTAAGGRALTHAQYLSALVALHERVRQSADAGDDGAREALDALGLASVTV